MSVPSLFAGSAAPGVLPGGAVIAGDAADGLSAVAPAFLAVVLAAVHLSAGRLHLLDALSQRRALSLAGGVSVAYVFVRVLPEVDRAEDSVAATIPALTVFEEHVYLVALGGFVAFYGLEQFVRRSREGSPTGETPAGAFWIHVGSFAIYNGLIGYLLFHQQAPGLESPVAFGVAMGLHFFVTDYGLRRHHETRYARVGRWILAVAILAGAAVGAATDVGRHLLGALFAFLAGGLILNVVKEELPAEGESRFWVFALGAAGNAALLLLT